jgi:hypothetical protein
MANLLQQAINCNDGDRAAKIIKTRSVSRAMTSPIFASRRPGRMIVSSAPALSAKCCKPRHAFWPHRA